MIEKIKTWIKNNRVEAFFLGIILLIGAFLRLYRIDEYMTFLGDEGRDALIVRRLLVNFDPILVGPGTSIGNMYLGPLYYYLIAPALLLANFSPAGPAVMIALLGIITIWMVWYITREWFSRSFKGENLQAGNKVNVGALIAAALYAISPVIIIYSRSSWNPNIMPFFSLLCIYSIWRVYRFNEYKWLVALGISFAFALNSHYLGLLLIPVLGIYWFFTFINLYRSRITVHSTQKRKFILFSFTGFIIFVFLMSPVAIFDARHNFINFYAMKNFFTIRQETVSIKPWSSLPKLIPLSEKITSRLITGMNTETGKLFSIFLLISTVIAFITSLRSDLVKKYREPFLLLFLWIGFSLIGLGVYKQEIYDHYYGFFFTAPFMLIGGLTQTLFDWSKKRNFLIRVLLSFVILIFFCVLVIINLKNNPLNYSPNRQMQRSMEVSKVIEEESKGREFNLAVIAERNYEGAYQYFLEKDGAPLVMIDAQKSNETIKDQLFVVCELPKEKCDPTHNAKAEVANFGWSKIEWQKEVSGVILFKLVHY